MQLDLLELLEAPEREARAEAARENRLQGIKRRNEAIGMDVFERIKADRGLQICLDNLPWKALKIAPEYEKCNVLAVIPPNALCGLEYTMRFPKAHYDDLVKREFEDLWVNYTHCIWNYKPHNADWCKAFRLLEVCRDKGEPIWMQLSRTHGKLSFMPDCIVGIEDVQAMNMA